MSIMKRKKSPNFLARLGITPFKGLSVYVQTKDARFHAKGSPLPVITGAAGVLTCGIIVVCLGYRLWPIIAGTIAGILIGLLIGILYGRVKYQNEGGLHYAGETISALFALRADVREKAILIPSIIGGTGGCFLGAVISFVMRQL